MPRFCDRHEMYFVKDVASGNWQCPDCPGASLPSGTPVYYCKACPATFMDAATSNAHHDATGHNQTWRPSMAYAAVSPSPTTPPDEAQSSATLDTDSGEGARTVSRAAPDWTADDDPTLEADLKRLRELGGDAFFAFEKRLNEGAKAAAPTTPAPRCPTCGYEYTPGEVCTKCGTVAEGMFALYRYVLARQLGYCLVSDEGGFRPDAASHVTFSEFDEIVTHLAARPRPAVPPEPSIEQQRCYSAIRRMGKAIADAGHWEEMAAPESPWRVAQAELFAAIDRLAAPPAGAPTLTAEQVEALVAAGRDPAPFIATPLQAGTAGAPEAATLEELRAEEIVIERAIIAGKAYVDRCLKEHGYDSMEFAEARATWHAMEFTLRPFRTTVEIIQAFERGARTFGEIDKLYARALAARPSDTRAGETIADATAKVIAKYIDPTVLSDADVPIYEAACERVTEILARPTPQERDA